MKRAAISCVAAALSFASPGSMAAGASQPKPNKDFRELIVHGERPEIAACLAAAIERARDDPSFSAIRWGDDASDRAVMQESEHDGKKLRFIRLMAHMRVRGSPIALESWRRVEVKCEQPEDGAVRVEMKAVGR